MKHAESRPRLLWKKEEDEALIYLKQDLKIQKWTEIAEKLTSTYHIQNRNHQQCRDRYVNFLKNHVDNKKWSHENFQKLIDLYQTHGNKWSQIANHFENINGLLIKNKFYSRLRKGIRNINFFIQTFLNDTWEKFSFNLTFKLINCAANKFDYSEKSVLGKKIENQITFVQEIVKNVFNVSWPDKRQLSKAFKSKKIYAFHRENLDKLIQDINFIDENLDKKHSNRRIFKQKSLNHNTDQTIRGNNKKIDGLRNDRKIEKDKIEPLNVIQNKIAYAQKQPKILIISVNSFQKLGQIYSQEDGSYLQRDSLEQESYSEGKDETQRIPLKYSGYRQHKFEEIKLQANCSAQVEFSEYDNMCEQRRLNTHEAQIHRIQLD